MERDIYITEYKQVISPNALQRELESEFRPEVIRNAETTVIRGRTTAKNILDGTTNKLICIVGPCSIHNPSEAFEYAKQLQKLAKEVEQTTAVYMRTYFEKPRSTIGWEGFDKDPHLDGSNQTDEGLYEARKLLIKINNLGIPTATEALDPILIQYTADQFSLFSIGARTTESQTHRALASGLSAPVGFKNGTDGNYDIAINAIISAQHLHTFRGIHPDGWLADVSTKGNPYGFVILRGGKEPNYTAPHVMKVLDTLRQKGVRRTIGIDCSHGNSEKDYRKQHLVLTDVIDQIVAGNNAIVAVMLESYLREGNQPIQLELKPGVSITDGCIGLEETQRIIREMHARLRELTYDRTAPYSIRLGREYETLEEKMRQHLIEPEELT